MFQQAQITAENAVIQTPVICARVGRHRQVAIRMKVTRVKTQRTKVVIIWKNISEVTHEIIARENCAGAQKGNTKSSQQVLFPQRMSNGFQRVTGVPTDIKYHHVVIRAKRHSAQVLVQAPMVIPIFPATKTQRPVLPTAENEGGVCSKVMSS